jgi:thiosulfate/3-mercaptopyruvate sulfurtransferase
MSYSNPGALVTTDWLEANLSDPNVRVVEVDEDATVYDKDHIPGAIAWSWSDDLHHPLRRDYLDREGFGRLLSAAGVGPDTTVVLYGGNNNWFAAYAYWLLKYRGFDNVKLLDGGRKKWNAESLPLESERSEVTPTNFTITGPERPQLRAYRDHVLETLGSGRRSPPIISPRSSRTWPVTSPEPRTSLGARQPTRTAPSRRPRS